MYHYYLPPELFGDPLWQPGDHLHGVLPLGVSWVAGERVKAETDPGVLAWNEKKREILRAVGRIQYPSGRIHIRTVL